jgi:hypothetical protein
MHYFKLWHCSYKHARRPFHFGTIHQNLQPNDGRQHDDMPPLAISADCTAPACCLQAAALGGTPESSPVSCRVLPASTVEQLEPFFDKQLKQVSHRTTPYVTVHAFWQWSQPSHSSWPGKLPKHTHSIMWREVDKQELFGYL